MMLQKTELLAAECASQERAGQAAAIRLSDAFLNAWWLMQSVFRCE
jgi:hypothetical protein